MRKENLKKLMHYAKRNMYGLTVAGGFLLGGMTVTGFSGTVLAEEPGVPHFEETEEGLRFFDADGNVVTKQWILFEGLDYYADQDGSIVADRFFAPGNGHTYYFAEDGVLQYGVFEVDSALYYADGRGWVRQSSGWISSEGSWYFANADGTLRRDCAIWSGGTYYYAGSNGALTGGLHEAGGKLRYFDASGALVKKEGWVAADDVWYYLNVDGTLRKNAVVPDKKNFYYVGEDGKLTDKILEVEGVLRYFDKNGRMKQNSGWVLYEGDWYFLNSQGVVCTGMITRDAAGTLYLLGEDGKAGEGMFETEEGKTLYFKKDGALGKNAGWIVYDGSWFYIDADGAVSKDTTVVTGGKTYYVGEDGKLAGGFRTIDEKLRYFFADGRMKANAGWFLVEEKWYYSIPDGEVLTGGKYKIGKKYYYFDDKGVMATGVINAGEGVLYKADENGVIATNTDVVIDELTYHAGADGTIQAGTMTKKAQQYSSDTDYLILCNLKTFRTAVYKGKKDNWVLQKEFICSVGKPSSPTPTGEYKTTVHSLNFVSFGSRCWYATGFIGGLYLFHSEPYKIEDTPAHVLEPEMGKANSHGCVRLRLADAKWMYDTLPLRTKVVIFSE